MKKGWIVIKANGSKEEYEANKAPSLEQMQKAVGGYIEYHSCTYEGRKRTMVVNEEGKLHNLPVNNEATKLFGAELVGDVMVLIGYRG